MNAPTDAGTATTPTVADVQMIDGYELVIGLECHAELHTATKIFCGCPNNFGDEPNTNVCPVYPQDVRRAFGQVTEIENGGAVVATRRDRLRDHRVDLHALEPAGAQHELRLPQIRLRGDMKARRVEQAATYA